jgi:hypothetical protein
MLSHIGEAKHVGKVRHTRTDERIVEKNWMEADILEDL